MFSADILSRGETSPLLTPLLTHLIKEKDPGALLLQELTPGFQTIQAKHLFNSHKVIIWKNVSMGKLKMEKLEMIREFVNNYKTHLW